jgi:hypothetical protein
MSRVAICILAACSFCLAPGCSSRKQEAEEARAEAAKAREELEALRAEVVKLRAASVGAAKQNNGKAPPVVSKVRPADYANLKDLLKALPEDRKPRQAFADVRQDAVGEWYSKNAENKIVRFRAIYQEGQRDSGRNIMTFWETREDLGLPGAIVLPMAIFGPRIDQEDELKALQRGTERTVQGRIVMVDVRPSGEKGKYLLEVRLGDAEFADR